MQILVQYYNDIDDDIKNNSYKVPRNVLGTMHKPS